MKKKNNNNRYYCHRMQTSGYIDGKTLYVYWNNIESVYSDKYARRLAEVYNYRLQLTFLENHKCIYCGCTDLDCSQCIKETGKPCSWANEEKTICTACVDSK